MKRETVERALVVPPDVLEVSVGIDPGFVRLGRALVARREAPAGPTPLWDRPTVSARETTRRELVERGRRLVVLEAETVGFVEPLNAPVGLGPLVAAFAADFRAWLRDWLERLRGADGAAPLFSLVLEQQRRPSHMSDRGFGLTVLVGALIQAALSEGVLPERVCVLSARLKLSTSTQALLGDCPGVDVRRTAVRAGRVGRKREAVRLVARWRARLGEREPPWSPTNQFHWDAADAVLMAVQTWRGEGSFQTPAPIQRALRLDGRPSSPPPDAEKAARGDKRGRVLDPGVPPAWHHW